MKNIEVYNTLNIDKDSSSIVATFTQEDDAVMEFKLFKDGQEIVLKDQTISLGAERKDGAVIEQEDGFLIKEDNVLNITLKKNIISVVGVVKIQLYLKDTSGEMASNTFNIRVNKKLLGAENVEATNDIKVLNTLVLELKNNTNKLIDDTKAKADKLLNGLQETGDNISSTVKAKTDKLIEDTKKDYDSLKKTIIDENISIKLQEDIKLLQNGLKSNQALSYEGSSISANDTLEGRTEGMRIKGKTLQNLVDYKDFEKKFPDVVSDKKIIFNTSHAVGSLRIDLDLLENNTLYTICFNVIQLPSESNMPVRITDDGLDYGISIKGLEINSLGLKKATFTTKAKFCELTFYNNEKNNGLIISYPIILKGDWTNKETPNFFEGIKSFGEAEQEGDKYKISILSNGKNLFDKVKILENKSIDQTTGVIYDLSGAFVSDYISIEKSITITLGDGGDHLKRVCYFDSNKQPLAIPGVYTTSNFATVNPRNNAKYIRFQSWLNSVDIIQAEEGTKATPYEPYKEDKKDILIKEPLHESNYLYEDNGQVKVYEKKKKYTFTGDEDFGYMRQTDEYISFYCNISSSLNLLKSSEMICNNFCFVANRGQITEALLEGFTDSSMDNRMSFSINKSKLSSPNVEGFKAWLKANPTEIIYQLATPVTEVVESIDIDLDTFQDKTYFNILNSLPGTLDFKVPSNIGSSLQNLAKEVNNIWDVINNLLVPGILNVNKKVALATIKNNLK